MVTRSDDKKLAVTSKLDDTKLWDLQLSEQDVTYRAVPNDNGARGAANSPTWRVRFDLAFDASRSFGLDVNGEVVLGRAPDDTGFVSLDDFDADELGVSRSHALLRPTESKLYILDLGSTNGTWLDGRSIGVNMPYSLSNGALLTLGKLDFIVKIIQQPTGYSEALQAQIDPTTVLARIVEAINSQLDINEVLKQAIEMTLSIASIDEASIWLVDEQTGELFLEAERGIQDMQIKRMRLSVSDTLAGKVIRTAKPLLANRQAGSDRIKLKTGYLVDAVIYVPLTLGGVTFGVLSAVHREDGRVFTQHEVTLMMAIANFTAIAVQNARLYQATDYALTKRTKVLTALNYILSYDLKNLSKAMIGYTGLLSSYDSLDEDTSDIVEQIGEAGGEMGQLIDRLIEVTSLCDDRVMYHRPCDLVDAVTRVVEDQKRTAEAKSISLDFRMMGEPQMILGDAAHLYRSVYNLVDNAIKYSPPGARAMIVLAFGTNDIIIQVRDTGPGIPEEHLPHIFDKYFRGIQPAGVQAGLGLGLEVVRATVEAHKGTVIARNVEGQGAEFIISLPATLQVTGNPIATIYDTMLPHKKGVAYKT